QQRDVAGPRLDSADGPESFKKRLGRDNRRSHPDCSEGRVCRFVFVARASRHEQSEYQYATCHGELVVSVRRRKVDSAIQAAATSSMYCDSTSRALRCASKTFGSEAAPAR